MAKKQKRKVTSGTSVQSETAVKVNTSTSRSSDFNPDYTYVKKDLKRIGLLAGSFFIVLIVLSFFLR